MSDYILNPLTGLDAPIHVQEYEGINQYRRIQGGCLFGITLLLEEQGFSWDSCLDTPNLKLSKRDTKRLLSFAATKLKKAHEFDRDANDYKPPLFMTSDDYDNLVHIGEARDKLFRFWRVWTVEELWLEAARLSFQNKALLTLANLVDLEPEIGLGVNLRFHFAPYPGVADYAINDYMDIREIAFACSKQEACLAMWHLANEELIQSIDAISLGTTIGITPRGYAAVESLNDGLSASIASAFLVCRFTEEMDEFFNKTYRTIGREDDFPCLIKRVKDITHNERIDDRILHEIQKSSIIVVDLTESNFNIGFEAGYALSQGKPIVWTMRKQETEVRLPFDIQSHNILFYELNKLEEFLETLRARLWVALGRFGEAPINPGSSTSH